VKRRLRDFIEGLRLFAAGTGFWSSKGRLMALALVPAVIALVILGSAFIAVLMLADDWAAALIEFITHDPTPPGFAVAVVTVAIIASAFMLAVFSFTALTLLIGQPFYERLADAAMDSVGLVPSAEEPWWRGTWRGVTESIALLAIGVCFSIGLFLTGLLPAVGTVLAFVGNALIGGTLLTLELTAYPLSRVGVRTLRGRWALFKQHRSLVTGFGVTAFLIFLVPGGAVFTMPSAVAGATLLASRMVQGAPTPAHPEPAAAN